MSIPFITPNKIPALGLCQSTFHNLLPIHKRNVPVHDEQTKKKKRKPQGKTVSVAHNKPRENVVLWAVFTRVSGLPVDAMVD